MRKTIVNLLVAIDSFKKEYTEEGRVVGNAEKRLYKTIIENY